MRLAVPSYKQVRQREVAAALQYLIIIMPNSRRSSSANNNMTAFHMISPRVICRLICLTLLPCLFLTAAAAGTDTNSPQPGFAAKLSTACAEKKIDDKLSALVYLGKALSLS